ncbi:MAG: GlsB/YeaQ/YmgE family stress response membrane protein [Erythrobacter sp.]
MALLVLIVLGATLGWLGSIIARTEAPGQILRQIAAGIAVSLIAGLLANGGTMLGSLSFIALGAALVATCGMLVIYHAISGAKPPKTAGDQAEA